VVEILLNSGWSNGKINADYIVEQLGESLADFSLFDKIKERTLQCNNSMVVLR
jgi:hypothetical protein